MRIEVEPGEEQAGDLAVLGDVEHELSPVGASGTIGVWNYDGEPTDWRAFSAATLRKLGFQIVREVPEKQEVRVWEERVRIDCLDGSNVRRQLILIGGDGLLAQQPVWVSTARPLTFEGQPEKFPEWLLGQGFRNQTIIEIEAAARKEGIEIPE